MKGMKSVDLEKILSAGREQDSLKKAAVSHATNGLGAQMMHEEVIAPDVGRALVVIRSVSETFQETTCVGPESIAAGYTAGHASGNTRRKSKMQQRHTMRVVREAGAQVDSVWSRSSLHVLTSI